MNRIHEELDFFSLLINQCIEIHLSQKSKSFSTQICLKKAGLIFICIISLFTMEGCAPSLISSAIDGDIIEVRKLLDKGTDVNIKNEQTYYFHYTALMAAACNGHIEIAKLLIAKGANLNDIAPGWEEGVTALMAATSNGHSEIVRLLLNVGADVNAKNPSGCNAIWFAFNGIYTDEEIVKYLLENGADVNAETIWGPIWLRALSSTGSSKIIKQLVTNHVYIPSKNAYIVIPDYWLTVRLNDTFDFYNSEGLRPLKTCYKIIDAGTNKIAAGISAGDDRSGRWYSQENKEFDFIAKEGHIYFVNFKIIESPGLFETGSWNVWIEEYHGQNNVESK